MMFLESDVALMTYLDEKQGLPYYEIMFWCRRCRGWRGCSVTTINQCKNKYSNFTHKNMFADKKLEVLNQYANSTSDQVKNEKNDFCFAVYIDETLTQCHKITRIYIEKKSSRHIIWVLDKNTVAKSYIIFKYSWKKHDGCKNIPGLGLQSDCNLMSWLCIYIVMVLYTLRTHAYIYINIYIYIYIYIYVRTCYVLMYLILHFSFRVESIKNC